MSELYTEYDTTFDKAVGNAVDNDEEENNETQPEETGKLRMKHSYTEHIMETKELPIEDQVQKIRFQSLKPHFFSEMRKKDQSLEIFSKVGTKSKRVYGLSLYDQLSEQSVSSPCLSMKYERWHYGDLNLSKPISEHDLVTSQLVDDSHKPNITEIEDGSDNMLEESDTEKTVYSKTKTRLDLIEKSLKALHKARSEDQKKLTLKGDNYGNKIRTCTHSAAQDILEDLKVKLMIKEIVSESIQEVFVSMKDTSMVRCQGLFDRQPHVSDYIVAAVDNTEENVLDKEKTNAKEIPFIGNEYQKIHGKSNISDNINMVACKKERPCQMCKQCTKDENENTSVSAIESMQPLGSDCSELTENTEIEGSEAEADKLQNSTTSKSDNGFHFKESIVNNLSKENDHLMKMTGMTHPFTEKMNNHSPKNVAKPIKQNHSKNKMMLAETSTKYNNVINLTHIKIGKSNEPNSSFKSGNKTQNSTKSRDGTWERNASSFKVDSSLTKTMLADHHEQRFENSKKMPEQESRNMFYTDQFGQQMHAPTSNLESVAHQQSDIFKEKINNNLSNGSHHDPMKITSFLAFQGYPKNAYQAVKHYRVEKNHANSFKNRERAQNFKSPNIFLERKDDENNSFKNQGFADDYMSTRSSLHSCNLCEALAQENSYLSCKIKKFKKALQEIRSYVHECQHIHYESCKLQEENRHLQTSIQLLEEEFQHCCSYRSNLEKERSNLRKELTNKMLDLENREKELQNKKLQFREVYLDKEMSEAKARWHIQNLEDAIITQRTYFHKVLKDLKQELFSICSSHIETISTSHQQLP